MMVQGGLINGEGNCRTLAESARDPNLPTMGLNQLFDDSQT